MPETDEDPGPMPELKPTKSHRKARIIIGAGVAVVIIALLAAFTSAQNQPKNASASAATAAKAKFAKAKRENAKRAADKRAADKRATASPEATPSSATPSPTTTAAPSGSQSHVEGARSREAALGTAIGRALVKTRTGSHHHKIRRHRQQHHHRRVHHHRRHH